MPEGLYRENLASVAQSDHLRVQSLRGAWRKVSRMKKGHPLPSDPFVNSNPTLSQASNGAISLSSAQYNTGLRTIARGFRCYINERIT